MNREQKAGMVEDLHTRFRSTPFVVLADIFILPVTVVHRRHFHCTRTVVRWCR